MELSDVPHPDARREAIFQRLIKTTPTIFCPSGNKIIEVCTNPQCKNALKCNIEECKTCGEEIHDGCLPLSLDKITKLFNKKTQQLRSKIADIFIIEEDIIDKIRRGQEQFMERFLEGQLKQEVLQAIKRIYEEKKFNALSGKQANEMCLNLQKTAKIDEKEMGERLLSYQNIMKRYIDSLVPIKQKCFLEQYNSFTLKQQEKRRHFEVDKQDINANYQKPTIRWTKIGAIQPGDEQLYLRAKIVKIEQYPYVILGDETGIANARFNLQQQFTEVIEGETVEIHGACAQVVKEHIEIQLMKLKSRRENCKVIRTSQSKLSEVDKTNNISLMSWMQV